MTPQKDEVVYRSLLLQGCRPHLRARAMAPACASLPSSRRPYGARARARMAALRARTQALAS